MPARQPEECHTQWVEAYNAGDLDQMLTFYEPECVAVAQPGQVVAGTEAIRQWLQGFLALQGTIDLRVRRVLQAGDVALVVSDWTLAGKGPDGSAVNLGGTSTDVVRRQADGTWRYAIDNPLGLQGV